VTSPLLQDVVINRNVQFVEDNKNLDLIMAVSNRETESVKALLSEVADINTQRDDKMSPLNVA